MISLISSSISKISISTLQILQGSTAGPWRNSTTLQYKQIVLDHQRAPQYLLIKFEAGNSKLEASECLNRMFDEVFPARETPTLPLHESTNHGTPTWEPLKYADKEENQRP
ncbi:hypothetical protein N7G274_006346 [Stereocaulon virgatum]|uniref:Uncharacterized protein n=1 Tax=Stereocaulon virgatum TaxID=373712 RepID=A0ABR4A5E7_9LECA